VVHYGHFHGHSESLKLVPIENLYTICKIHCNYVPIFYCFQDTTMRPKISIFPFSPTSISFDALATVVFMGPMCEIWCLKTTVAALPSGENCTILWSLILTWYDKTKVYHITSNTSFGLMHFTYIPYMQQVWENNVQMSNQW